VFFSFFRFFSKLICLFWFFRLFRYGFETPERTEPKIFFGFAKQTENQPKKIISFALFRLEPTIFLFCFMNTLVFMLLFSFFRFVSKQIYLFRLFRLFRNGLKMPKRTETKRNKMFLVSRNKPKNNRKRFSFGLFRFEPKIFFVCFENTLEKWLQKQAENGSGDLFSLRV
jgi:hypothetical protein